MHIYTYSRSRGFTLIELSMVLVIIGLLAGGILIGRDLIRAAQVRATVSQLESVRTAVNTFRLKYNALPGDMVNATMFWPNSQNGNGNGIIENYAPIEETMAIWDHLALAALIPGTYPTLPSGADYFHQFRPSPANIFAPPYDPAPKTRLGPYLMIQNAVLPYTSSIPLGTYFSWHTKPLFVGLDDNLLGFVDSCVAGFTENCSFMLPIDAQAIDEKIDDGRPDQGKMRDWAHGGNWCGTDSTKYDTTITIPSCLAVVPTGF